MQVKDLSYYMQQTFEIHEWHKRFPLCARITTVITLMISFIYLGYSVPLVNLFYFFWTCIPVLLSSFTIVKSMKGRTTSKIQFYIRFDLYKSSFKTYVIIYFYEQSFLVYYAWIVRKEVLELLIIFFIIIILMMINTKLVLCKWWNWEVIQCLCFYSWTAFKAWVGQLEDYDYHMISLTKFIVESTNKNQTLTTALPRHLYQFDMIAK